MIIKDKLIRIMSYLLIFCFSEMRSHAFGFLPGDEIQRVDIYSQSPTLVMFPAMVITSSCRPEGVVEFFKVEENTEFNESSTELSSLGELKETQLDLFLKLVPLQVSGEAACSFSLQNGSVLHLNMHLQENINRPILKIKEYSTSICLQEGRKAQSLFVELIQEGSQRLTAVTASMNLKRTDPGGNYKITHVGRFDDFKGIFIEVEADGLQKIPQRLTNVEVGEVYYSAILKDKKNVYTTQNKEKLAMLLLVRADVSIEDILKILPVIGGEKHEK